jgi:mannose-1-phosphate guanylyltransferase
MARHVVILAGGTGTRLWPRSREKLPKHLLTLHGRQSLLQLTFQRVNRLTNNVYVVTERSQVESIRGQLPDLPDERFIIEPARRGTASALGLAALIIAERDPKATMLSVHADHYLGHDEDAYLRTLEADPAVRVDRLRLHPGWAATQWPGDTTGISGGAVSGKA